MWLRDEEYRRVVGAPRHLYCSLLEELIHPIVDCLPMFQGNAELPDVHRVVVREVDLVLDHVCPSEVELPFANHVVVR